MILRRTWDRVRQGLWLIPSLLVLASAGLAALMVDLDSRKLSSAIQSSSLFFGGSAEGARGVLSAIAGSLITVTGVVFSITIVALQLASTQFTPRVLQNFMKDRGNQIVLGVFLGTFTYTLLVLRTIRSPVDGLQAFVPGLSVTVAVLLTLVSLGLLIYYLQHVTGWIEASSIIDRVTRDTIQQVRKRFPLVPESEGDDPHPARRAARMGASESAEAGFEPEGEAATVLAFESGYVQRTDYDGLLELAVERDLVIRLEHGAGDYVLEGIPLFTLWPRDALDADLAGRLRETVGLGMRRTISQDAELGLIQLSDIAVKAMSSSINDPTTAMMAIDHLARIIAELGGRAPRARMRADDAGRIRVLTPGFDFQSAAEIAFSQVRRYASGDATVLAHLAITLAVVGERVDRAERGVLIGLLDDVDEGAKIRIEHASDRRRVADAVARSRRRLAGMGATIALIATLFLAATPPALAQESAAADRGAADTVALAAEEAWKVWGARSAWLLGVGDADRPADVVLYALAASVAYERTASGDHWASDSVLGALWGYGVARVVIARREADRTDFVPFFDPGAGAVGVRIVTPFRGP